MPIIRSKPEVVAISRELVEDGSISFGARGLMAYIEAQPDKYEVDAARIPFHCHGGYAPMSTAQVRNEINGHIDELIASGYLVNA